MSDSVIVLCTCMFSEFLSASTPASFLYFMLEDFFTTNPDEKDAGLEAKVPKRSLNSDDSLLEYANPYRSPSGRDL